MSNNNPTALKGDATVEELLQEWHCSGVTNQTLVSELLKAKGYSMSSATVARRFKELGLKCAGAATKALPVEERRQLVLDEIARDPTCRQGPSMIKESIVFRTGVHLTRNCVRDEMHVHDPDGFALLEPSAKKIKWGVLISLGPHHKWSADGHDKLASIGFGIWGIHDKWCGKWLGVWVVPNNQQMNAVAYLYLKLIAELGGMPIQSTTDCGSETTFIFGLASALRAYFAPELDEVGIGAAHVFLKSIYNITIEQGWLRLCLTWIDNVKLFWEAGQGIYNPTVPEQYELVQWLWSMLIQQELDYFRDRQNNHKVRTSFNKMNPSGTPPNVAYTLCERFGGENCLQLVDVNVIHQLMEEIGGEQLIQFVSPEYAAYAESIFGTLGGIEKLTFQNVWLVFQEMLPLMSTTL